VALQDAVDFTNDPANLPSLTLPGGVLTDPQLDRMLYHCTGIFNTIAANAFCMVGCIAMDGTNMNDQCVNP
jgi:hypothetical protein